MRRIEPGRIDGHVDAPSSKSDMQRGVAAAFLARGESHLLNPAYAEDGLAALRAAASLGAIVRLSKEHVIIVGGQARRGGRADCGESGLCIRMFAPIAALGSDEVELVASGSLRARPMEMVEAALRALGASCSTANGKPPVRVRGPLRGGDIAVDGSVSSQLLTGLLLALPCCEQDSVLRVSGLESRPYVELTLRTAAAFGVEIRHDAELTRFEIRGGQAYRPRTWRVEGDWSGAAFLLVAGALAGSVDISGLDPFSAQADRAVLGALRAAGARVEEGADRIRVEAGQLCAFELDATDCPDLFPPLVALACSCEGTTRLHGAGRLRHKESDRAAALVEEFGKLGAQLVVDGDTLCVVGGRLHGGAVGSHGDHRMAMALAVAALRTREGVDLDGEGCVVKSYPDFFEHLDAIRVKA
jgi:3-phosphoshikimate 1-carboxyvinyltransferase